HLGDAEGDTYFSIEIVTGSDFGDTLVGGALSETFLGKLGNDVLDGAGGADTLKGGDGNDNYYVDNIGDLALELANEGLDTVYATANFTLAADVETLVMQGSADLQGYGNSGVNLLYGNSGNNLLNGGGGADGMLGGPGNDVYFVDHMSDNVVENANEGNDTVFSTVHCTLSANVENLVLQGAANLQGHGNGSANVIYGNAGQNLLKGGGGADLMVGGAGNESYFVDDISDSCFEAANEGTDSVFASVNYGIAADIENLILQGAADLQAYGN